MQPYCGIQSAPREDASALGAMRKLHSFIFAGKRDGVVSDYVSHSKTDDRHATSLFSSIFNGLCQAFCASGGNIFLFRRSRGVLTAAGRPRILSRGGPPDDPKGT